MIITITGPRSVGKSTITKIVSEKLGLTRVSSDELGEKAWANEGGLDTVMKSGKVVELVKKGGYTMIENEFNGNNFVFDLSGGSISATKPEMKEFSARLRKIAREKSIVIGLLPFPTEKESVFHLFEREKKREHFKEISEEELIAQTEKDYLKFPAVFKDFCHAVVFTRGRSAEEVADEIIEKVGELSHTR